ncbi:hypothetical protein YC2023_043164 [Brassica napus]
MAERALPRCLSLEFEVDLSESRESLADEIKINDLTRGRKEDKLAIKVDIWGYGGRRPRGASLFFVVARFWSKDAVARRTSARKVSPSDQGSNPGGGGSYSSIAAGLSPGDGGLPNSVAAGCVARKGRFTQLCRRRLLFPKGGGSQISVLSA